MRRRQWHPTPVLLPGKSHGQRSLVGCSPWDREESDTTERLPFTFHFHALDKEMATHSGVLAWRIPGTAESVGLPSMGSHKVGHDWSNLAAAAAEWNPMRMITIFCVWKISAYKYLGECYFLINKIHFQRNFRFTAKLKVKNSHIFTPPYMNNLPTINIPHDSGTFIKSQ